MCFRSEMFEFGCTQLRVPIGELERLKDSLNFSPCGVAFVKQPVVRGVLPRMLEEILNTRLMVSYYAVYAKHSQINCVNNWNAYNFSGFTAILLLFWTLKSVSFHHNCLQILLLYLFGKSWTSGKVLYIVVFLHVFFLSAILVVLKSTKLLFFSLETLPAVCLLQD